MRITSASDLTTALSAPAPRTVELAFAGVVEQRLSTPAGTTLDGSLGNVCFSGGLDVGDDCTLRHIRVRQAAVASGDAVQIVGRNVTLEHCSISWANDENVGVKRVEGVHDRDLTIAWCIIAEANKGVLAWYCDRLDMHHNLLAHNYIRNPVFAGDATFPHRASIWNNVVYDFGDTGVALKGNVAANVVGNWFALGNPARLHRYSVNVERMDDGLPSPETRVYLAGNSGPHTRAGEPEWSEVRYDSGAEADESLHRAAAPFGTLPEATDAATAYDAVLTGAGAFPRDSVDARIVQEVREGLRPGSYPRGPAATRAWAAEQWAGLTYGAVPVVVEEPAPEPPAVRTFTVTVQGLGEFTVSIEEQ